MINLSLNKKILELDQNILQCWNIVDELRLIARSYDDSATTEDQKMNMIIGVAELYDRKFDELFNLYEAAIREQYKENKSV